MLDHLLPDPVAQFSLWFDDAKHTAAIADATAVCLATATPEGIPSARMVLLKSFDEKGFVFFTNLESRKGGELQSNPHAALCFYWPALGRQIRIEGAVEPVSAEEADAYFASRPRESQIGAWASAQSRPLSGKAAFMTRIAAQAARFLGRNVSRPPHWSGFRIVPNSIEFWQEGQFRLHERMRYQRHSEGWVRQLLYP